MGEKIKTLDRERFLKRFSFKDVILPDCSIVRIRALPASYLFSGPEDRFSPAKLLVNSLCDEQGDLFFSDYESDAAMCVDGASMKVILDAVLELNGLARPGEDSGKAAEKN